MTEWMKTALGLILIILFAAILYFAKKNKNSEFEMTLDTNVVKRYEKEIKRDTVYRLIDNIIYKKSSPEKIYVQRVDTVFISKINSYDLPLRIEKTGNEMNVKAVNIKDSVLKEYVFRNISRDFVLNSLNRNLTVKAKNFYFEKPMLVLSLSHELSGNNNSTRYIVGMESGLSYREKIYLSAGIKYLPKEEKLNAGISLKFKPF